MFRFGLITVVIVVSVSCAAPTLTGQTGRVTPKHQLRVAAGAQVGLAPSSFDTVQKGADAALSQTKCGDGTSAQCYTLDNYRPLVKAAYALTLATPVQPHTELSARLGLFDGVDVGAHLGSGGFRLDAGMQLFGPYDRTEPGWAGSVFLGWNHHSGFIARQFADGPTKQVLDVVSASAGREDFDMVTVIGRQFGEFGHLFLGGRYMLSRWSLDITPALPIVYEDGSIQKTLLGTDTSGFLHQFGALAGGAIGYRYVFLGAEVNLVYYHGSARLLFQEETIDGLAVVPSVFLYTQF